MASNVLIATCFGIAVQALAFDGRPAKPTDHTVPSTTRDFPSHITVPPSVFELAKRQEAQTVLVGPDNTCGYISGRAGAAYSCNDVMATCAFVTTAGVGAVACCDAYDCGIRVDCIDYEGILSSSCDYGCLQDTFTVKCMDVTYPYCGTVSFFDGVVDYYCDSNSGSFAQKAETTYSGESDGRSFTPVEVTVETDTNTDTDTDTGTNTRTNTRTTTTASDNGDEDSATAGATDTDSSSPTETDGSDAASTSGASAGAPSPAGGSSTNIGAIVGGVVGGVGGIALICLVAFLLIRRNKKKKNLQQQQLQQPPQQPGGYPPMQQQPPQGPGPAPGHQSVYNPGYPPQQQQQQYAMQPNQQQPGVLPPGYFHQDQNKPGGFVGIGGVPDRNDSTSPVSQMGDNRMSMQQQQQPSSPTSTIHSSYPPSQYGQQQQAGYPVSGVPPTVHEAGGNVVGQNGWNDNHHGQFHELPTRD